MAGDWIKMRGSLMTHPKVLRMASMIADDPNVGNQLGIGKPLRECVTRDVTRDVTMSHREEKRREDIKPTSMSDKSDASPIKSDFKATAIRVIEFLNQKTGKAYRPVPANLEKVMARLKDGATEQDCKSIIARKVRDWQTDDKMREYLRPATLFNREKFAQYQGQLVVTETLP